MPNNTNQFATMQPILMSPNADIENTKRYYEENGITPDNDYMTKYLYTPESKSIVGQKPRESVNIAELITKAANPASYGEYQQTTNTLDNISAANTKLSGKPKDFLKTYSNAAIVAERDTGISKDLILAQLALETGWGEHTPGYNLGGIKADSSWKGKSRLSKTKEQGKNGLYSTTEKFRVYNTPEEGFKDYVAFLTTNKRYKPLIGVKDPLKAAEIMAKTGYATDANYKQKLQSIIKQIQTNKE